MAIVSLFSLLFVEGHNFEAQHSDIINNQPSSMPCRCRGLSSIWFISLSHLLKFGFNKVVQMLSLFHYLTIIGQMGPVSETDKW